MRARAVVEVVLGVAAAAGCVASWVLSRSTVTIPPIDDGEPSIPSVAYHPPLLVLAFMLAALAGVLLVVGIARWRLRGGAHSDTPQNAGMERTLAVDESSREPHHR